MIGMTEYGRANLIEMKWGLNPLIGGKIAAVIIFGGSIEYYLERAIWRVKKIEPNGNRPETDAKMITDLIAMLRTFATTLPTGNARKLLEIWCEAARSGFVIRHNIVHGVPMQIGNALALARNPRWHGETRKREFGDFWADNNTLDLVREAFAVLLRVIVQVEAGRLALTEIAEPHALHAMRDARSILGEFASQDYNPSFEKY